MTKRRKKSAAVKLWRTLFGRLGMALFVIAIGTQYARIIMRNIVVSHQVSASETEIVALKAQRADEEARIHRLEQPTGAVPEIHDRLHLTAPGEAIVYLHHEGDGGAQTFDQH